jgi:hypothetical protein
MRKSAARRAPLRIPLPSSAAPPARDEFEDHDTEDVRGQEQDENPYTSVMDELAASAERQRQQEEEEEEEEKEEEDGDEANGDEVERDDDDDEQGQDDDYARMVSAVEEMEEENIDDELERLRSFGAPSYAGGMVGEYAGRSGGEDGADALLARLRGMSGSAGGADAGLVGAAPQRGGPPQWVPRVPPPNPLDVPDERPPRCEHSTCVRGESAAEPC